MPDWIKDNWAGPVAAVLAVGLTAMAGFKGHATFNIERLVSIAQASVSVAGVLVGFYVTTASLLLTLVKTPIGASVAALGGVARVVVILGHASVVTGVWLVFSMLLLGTNLAEQHSTLSALLFLGLSIWSLVMASLMTVHGLRLLSD